MSKHGRRVAWDPSGRSTVMVAFGAAHAAISWGTRRGLLIAPPEVAALAAKRAKARVEDELSRIRPVIRDIGLPVLRKHQRKSIDFGTRDAIELVHEAVVVCRTRGREGVVEIRRGVRGAWR